MKHRISLIVTALVIVLLSSCSKEENFDQTLIPGKWKTGTVYYVFSADGLGHTWDVADDITESEAQQLSWKVTISKFTITHYGEMGEVIPKTYTIKTLTSTTFIFADDYGNTTTLTKVE